MAPDAAAGKTIKRAEKFLQNTRSSKAEKDHSGRGTVDVVSTAYNAR
jgi:hypothetical protein